MQERRLSVEKVKTLYAWINDFLIVIGYYYGSSYSCHLVLILITFSCTHPITTM